MRKQKKTKIKQNNKAAKLIYNQTKNHKNKMKLIKNRILIKNQGKANCNNNNNNRNNNNNNTKKNNYKKRTKQMSKNSRLKKQFMNKSQKKRILKRKF